MALNENKSGDSSLRDWFSKSRSSDGKPGWVQLGGKYAGKPCAKQPGQTTKPKCGSSKMKRALSKDEEEAAFRRKNRQDPNPDRKGKAINVKTEETVNERADTWHPDPEKDRKLGGPGANQRAREDRAAASKPKEDPKKLRSGESYYDYAKRQKGASATSKPKERKRDKIGKAIGRAIDKIGGIKTEETSMTIDSSAHKTRQRREKMRALMQRGVGGERDAAKRKLGNTAELPKLKKEEALDEKCWKGYTAKGLKKKGNRMVPNCVPVGEETIEERSLTKGEEKDKEKYVKGMKKSAKDFKARYGDDYKSVMYATATKMAKEEKEGDHEFEMARRQLATMKNAANRLEKKMGKKGEGNLKAWVQSKLTKAADYADTAADYVTNEAKNVHGQIENPSSGLKKLVSKAVKRIDTDVDGDVEHNDKHKGEYGEFVPTGGDPRKAQGRQYTSIKSVKEALGEVDEIDEGIKMALVRAIDKTKPGPLTRRGRIRDKLVRSEIKSAAEKSKKRRFSGIAASEKASKADKYMSSASKTTASESFDIEESAEKRYCPKCEKMETKSECSYGPEYWEKNAKKQTSESAAWTRKAGKNKEGGLNEKGRKSYERENPGSDLKAPSKKVGNPRRKSFCARMSGMKKKLTSSKTANDPNSRINKSLRAWNC